MTKLTFLLLKNVVKTTLGSIDIILSHEQLAKLLKRKTQIASALDRTDVRQEPVYLPVFRWGLGGTNPSLRFLVITRLFEWWIEGLSRGPNMSLLKDVYGHRFVIKVLPEGVGEILKIFLLVKRLFPEISKNLTMWFIEPIDVNSYEDGYAGKIFVNNKFGEMMIEIPLKADVKLDNRTGERFSRLMQFENKPVYKDGEYSFNSKSYVYVSISEANLTWMVWLYEKKKISLSSLIEQLIANNKKLVFYLPECRTKIQVKGPTHENSHFWITPKGRPSNKAPLAKQHVHYDSPLKNIISFDYEGVHLNELPYADFLPVKVIQMEASPSELDQLLIIKTLVAHAYKWSKIHKFPIFVLDKDQDVKAFITTIDIDPIFNPRDKKDLGLLRLIKLTKK